MLMNISLKKRTLLVLLSGLTATFTLAQQQPLPEWQSQYAVGLNKLAPHTYDGLTPTLPILKSREDMNSLLII